MIFGLDRKTDEQSLQELLQQLNREELTKVLIPRLQDEEINRLADTIMGLLRNHLSHQEYHALFLGDSHHNE